MTTCSDTVVNQAGLAFDRIAGDYDDLFTRSSIGRAQRDAVWDVLRGTFRPGERVLELNCGTGEDALFMARMGMSVLACDASERMVAVAARRVAKEPGGDRVKVEIRAIEQIGGLNAGMFDGAFSNFSGLNCVTDLAAVARRLADLIKPGGRLLLCLSSRICAWETLWFLAHGDVRRAGRRWRGAATVSLGEISVWVHYPTKKDIEKQFHPRFELRSCQGIGVFVPPSYVEHLASRYPGALRMLRALDRTVARWPVFRVIGDHTLFMLVRSEI